MKGPCDTIKRQNLYIMYINGEVPAKVIENIFNEIIAENSSNL
jgi:hypothetical protein